MMDWAEREGRVISDTQVSSSKDWVGGHLFPRAGRPLERNQVWGKTEVPSWTNGIQVQVGS